LTHSVECSCSPSVKKITTLALFILMQYKSGTDRQTDERTDISALAIPALAELARLPRWKVCNRVERAVFQTLQSVAAPRVYPLWPWPMATMAMAIMSEASIKQAAWSCLLPLIRHYQNAIDACTSTPLWFTYR